MVFRISVTLLVLLVLGAVIAPEAFGVLSAQVQAATLARAGWLYLAIVFGVLWRRKSAATSPGRARRRSTRAA